MTIQPKPVKPRPGQESVWDYPRPPRLEPFVGSITVELGGKTIASTTGLVHAAQSRRMENLGEVSRGDVDPGRSNQVMWRLRSGCGSLLACLQCSWRTYPRRSGGAPSLKNATGERAKGLTPRNVGRSLARCGQS